MTPTRRFALSVLVVAIGYAVIGFAMTGGGMGTGEAISLLVVFGAAAAVGLRREWVRLRHRPPPRRHGE